LIENNHVTGAAEGIHVATSMKPERVQPQIRSVRIQGNVISLSVPLELQAAPRGIFVGNGARTVARDNEIRVLTTGLVVMSGIEVFGLGGYLLVRDNTVSRSSTGVKIVQTGITDPLIRWAVMDNFLPFADLLVDAPEQVMQSGNVGEFII